MKKIKKFRATWKASFKDNMTKEAVIRLTKNAVKKAAKEAGIKDYDGAIQISDSFPNIF